MLQPSLVCVTVCVTVSLICPSPFDAAAQVPRDRGSVAHQTSSAAAEAALRRAIAAAPYDIQPTLELSRLQEDAGRIAEAEATLLEAERVLGPSVVLLHALAGLHNRVGDFEQTIHYFEQAVALDPGNPRGHHLIASYYQEKAAKDFRLTAWQKRTCIEAGIAAEDRALALDPDFIDALVYKNILLRMRANLEANPDEQERLIGEADALRNRAMQLQKMRPQTIDAPPAVPPPPPVATSSHPGMPPAPHAQRDDSGTADMYRGAVRLSPVRGGVQAPRRIAHVEPIRPPEAAAQNVRGVVIVEARIEPDGRVSHVRVLRSIPLLDQAAVDAVRQWLFEPPMIDGQPVAVVMPLTVPFLPTAPY